MCYMRVMRFWVVFLAACAHLAAIPTLPRMGHVHRTIATTSPVAQRHFDAGLALAYGFNYDEAAFEFEIALRVDPTCAMCWWGLGYVAGPNINDDGKQSPGAYPAAERAARFAARPVEKALTAALTKRLAANTMQYATRPQLHHAYAEAMREVARQFPEDVDVLVLATEALMVDTPRGPLWSKPDGRPSSANILEAQRLVEHALALAPDHIGAIHFYIHLLDDGPFQERTLPYADKLARLAPGAGHLIHMPSHVYLHLGRWADADDANQRAIAADRHYLESAPRGTQYDELANHPKDFLWYVLMWEGARKRTLELARQLATTPMSMMGADAGDSAGTYLPFTYIRFAMWDEALALPDPSGRASAVATHLARGLALVAKGKLADAAKEVAPIRDAGASRSIPREDAPPEAAAVFDEQKRRDEFRRLTAESAALQVTAAIAEARGDHAAAITALHTAVASEDKAPSLGEPPAWPLSARHRLGAVLLAAGQPREAADVYREDLRRHPHNGWALFGLATALDALHDPQAPATRREFEAAWARSDVKLRTSSF